MKPLILSLARIAFLAAAGSASAQGNSAAAVLASASQMGYDQQFQAARELAIAGRREEAIRAYSDLLARSPGNGDVLLGRGQVYAWMGRWQEAEADLRGAAAAAPGYAGTWSALGDMYLWSDHLLSLTPRVSNPDVVVPAGYRWSAGLAASWTEFGSGRPRWSDDTLSLRRHFERGSLALESLDVRRFGGSDHAWALDGYVDLWRRAYANLRYQHSAAPSLFPERSWRAELFQGVGRGWELSASYDRLEFTGSDVDMYGLGIGKYVGNFYLRARHLFISGAGSDSSNDLFLVRYYYAGDGDNYVEFSAGSGRSDDLLVNGPGGQTRHSSASAAFVKYPSPRWGFKIGADAGEEENGYAGRGVFGALYLRW